MKKYLLLSCVAAMSLSAMEFQSLGYESIGMGGAGVASAKGSMAGYYNPALLAKQRHSVEVALGAGMGLREMNIAENIDKLANEYKLSDTIKTLSDASTSLTTFQNALVGDTLTNLTKSQQLITTIATQTNGLQLQPQAYFSGQVNNFALGVYVTSDIAASTVIDATRTKIIIEKGGNYYKYDNGASAATTKADYDANSLQYALDNGKTYLKIAGLALAEIPLSYAQTVSTPYGDWDLGGSLKYMNATTYMTNLKLDTASGDINDQIKNRDKRSSNVGIDLGAIFSPKDHKELSIGLVGKNLNSPEFSTAGSEKIKVDRMARAGVAYHAFEDKLTLAADIDLTRNSTALDDIKSQNIGGGLNFHPASWFSMRAGAMKNIADSNDGTIMTAGIGLGLKWLQLDVAGQMSTKKGSFDGKEYPRYSKLNLTLVSKW